MTTAKLLLTAEDLLKLPDDGRFYELLDGELVEMSPPGGAHGKVTLMVGYHLLAHVKANELGEVLAGDPGIILRRNPDRVRAPDVCFIARERLPAGGIPAGYLEVVPDFIVEVVSPGDRAAEVQEKAEEWLRAGARLVWVLYPKTRSILAYQGLASARVYADADTITGAPVLPDFSIGVAELFS